MGRRRQKDVNTDVTGDKNVYLLPIIPGFFGILVVITPEWSSAYAYIWGVIMVLSLLWVVVGYIQQRHRDWSWHAFTNVIHWDLSALFMLFPFWRVMEQPIWLLFILSFLYVTCLILTHRYRKIIANSLWGSLRSRFGRIFKIAATLAVILTGGGSYGFTRWLQVLYGYNSALVIISTCLIPFSFIFIIMFHSQWVRVEDPNWDFDRKL